MAALSLMRQCAARSASRGPRMRTARSSTYVGAAAPMAVCSACVRGSKQRTQRRSETGLPIPRPRA
eukprot:8619699-Prorocentrum_lima.AAC.1